MSPHTLRATSYCFIKSAVKHEYHCTGSITNSTVIPLILSDQETINSDSLLLVPMFLLLDQFFLLISQSTQNSLGVGVGDFLGSPVVKNLPSSPAPKESAFQCRGWRFDPWWGNLDPTCFWETKPACRNWRKPVCHSKDPKQTKFFLKN